MGSTNTTGRRRRPACIARRTTARHEVVHHVFSRGVRNGIQFRGSRVGIAVHIYGTVRGGIIRTVGMVLRSWSSKKTCREYGGITRHAIVTREEGTWVGGKGGEKGVKNEGWINLW